MKIKLLKPYGFSNSGDVLDPDPPVAQLLIDRGLAEPLAPEPPTKAALAPPTHKVLPPRHTKSPKR